MLKFKNVSILNKIQKSFVSMMGYVNIHFMYVVNLSVHVTRMFTNVHIIF